MASPQKENGWTGIAHEILEKTAQFQLSGLARAIIGIVWRETYGRKGGPKTTQLSVNALVDKTGARKSTVAETVARLIKGNVLLQESGPDFRSMRRIGFNKDYETWTVRKYGTVRKSGQSEKTDLDSPGKVDWTVPETRTVRPFNVLENKDVAAPKDNKTSRDIPHSPQGGSLLPGMNECLCGGDAEQPRDTPVVLQAKWNALAVEAGMAECETLSDDRRRCAKRAIKEGLLAHWDSFAAALKGPEGAWHREQRLDFDWLCRKKCPWRGLIERHKASAPKSNPNASHFTTLHRLLAARIRTGDRVTFRGAEYTAFVVSAGISLVAGAGGDTAHWLPHAVMDELVAVPEEGLAGALERLVGVASSVVVGKGRE